MSRCCNSEPSTQNQVYRGVCWHRCFYQKLWAKQVVWVKHSATSLVPAVLVSTRIVLTLRIPTAMNHRGYLQANNMSVRHIISTYSGNILIKQPGSYAIHCAQTRCLRSQHSTSMEIPSAMVSGKHAHLWKPSTRCRYRYAGRIYREQRSHSDGLRWRDK